MTFSILLHHNRGRRGGHKRESLPLLPPLLLPFFEHPGNLAGRPQQAEDGEGQRDCDEDLQGQRHPDAGDGEAPPAIVERRAAAEVDGPPAGEDGEVGGGGGQEERAQEHAREDDENLVGLLQDLEEPFTYAEKYVLKCA